MAKNVTVQGASYTDVPAVNLPQTGGGTARFTDVTDTTATASDVASGKYFYTADGTKTLGTASGGGGGETIICNMLGGPLVGFAKICPPPGIGNVMIDLAKIA